MVILLILKVKQGLAGTRSIQVALPLYLMRAWSLMFVSSFQAVRLQIWNTSGQERFRRYFFFGISY